LQRFFSKENGKRHTTAEVAVDAGLCVGKIWVVVYIYRLGVGKNYGPLKIPKY
jgi:hypothetical protein